MFCNQIYIALDILPSMNLDIIELLIKPAIVPFLRLAIIDDPGYQQVG